MLRLVTYNHQHFCMYIIFSRHIEGTQSDTCQTPCLLVQLRSAVILASILCHKMGGKMKKRQSLYPWAAPVPPLIWAYTLSQQIINSSSGETVPAPTFYNPTGAQVLRYTQWEPNTFLRELEIRFYRFMSEQFQMEKIIFPSNPGPTVHCVILQGAILSLASEQPHENDSRRTGHQGLQASHHTIFSVSSYESRKMQQIM